nr:transposase [Kribbella speibonae]
MLDVRRAEGWRLRAESAAGPWRSARTGPRGRCCTGCAAGGPEARKPWSAWRASSQNPRGYGRCRMKILTDTSAATLQPFVTEHVEPGSTLITDGWQGYAGIDRLGYLHDRRSQRAARARGEDPGALLPGVHSVAASGFRTSPPTTSTVSSLSRMQ